MIFRQGTQQNHINPGIMAKDLNLVFRPRNPSIMIFGKEKQGSLTKIYADASKINLTQKYFSQFYLNKLSNFLSSSICFKISDQ